MLFSHGTVNNLGGYLVTVDTQRYDEGVAMNDVLNLGKPARGLGVTGDVVNFSKQVGKSVVHVNPVSQKTILLLKG